MLEKTPFASFGYVGANTMDNGINESKLLTQRFRIYGYVMNAFFRSNSFRRLYSEENSAILMLNLKNKDVEKLSSDATKMFMRPYPDLE